MQMPAPLIGLNRGHITTFGLIRHLLVTALFYKNTWKVPEVQLNWLFGLDRFSMNSYLRGYYCLSLLMINYVTSTYGKQERKVLKPSLCHTAIFVSQGNLRETK